MLLRSLLGVLVLVGVAYGRNAGPPENTVSVCDNISPNPLAGAHSAGPQSGNGNYVIATDAPHNATQGYYEYTAGQTYTGELSRHHMLLGHTNPCHV